ncbi:MAG: bile acid:sodium symporter family protein [Cyanobium sp.]
MQSSVITAVLLPLALGLVMLAMGLTLVPADFLRIWRQPRAVSLGLLCQMVVLPLLALLIARLVPMDPPIAVGLLVLAFCPVGPAAVLISFLARGDVALALTLTALSSALGVFTIPALTHQALPMVLAAEAVPPLPIGLTMLRICLITVLPAAVGMAIRARAPRTARAWEPRVGRLAASLLVLLILAVLVQERQKLLLFVLQAGPAVILLNGLGIAAALLVAHLGRLPGPQRLALAVVVGLQNAALAIGITAGLLNNPAMAVAPALYGLWMYFSAVLLVAAGRRVAARGAAADP